MKFLLQEFTRWKDSQIFGNVDTGLAEFEQFNLLLLFTSAKNEAKRRFFASLLLVPGKPAEIKFHLAFVLGLEIAELEVYGDEAAQTAYVVLCVACLIFYFLINSEQPEKGDVSKRPNDKQQVG